MVDKLKNRVAIVTGSGQGIGRSIAIFMAREGAKVITNNRKPGTKGGDAETTAKEITDEGGMAIPFYGDVSNFEIAQQLIQTAVDKFGTLDIMVNNAGADSPRMVWNLTEEDWDRCIDSYLKGSFNCTRWACRIMREKRYGRIINTTTLSWLGATGHVNYCAAKAGLVGLTRGVARELGRYGITCNAYAPTAGTRMTMNEAVLASFKKEYEAGILTREQYDSFLNAPSPDTVAPLVVYLCTEEAGNINGKVFFVREGEVSIFSEPQRIYQINKEEGLWTTEELIEMVPKGLLQGYVNPAPAEPPKE